MKKVQPFSIWVNGQMKSVQYMFLRCGTDNLQDSATFYFSLNAGALDKDGEEIPGSVLTEGNITMSGTDYETNEYAWNWAAQKLNITLIP
jgi:hypothetical protein